MDSSPTPPASTPTPDAIDEFARFVRMAVPDSRNQHAPESLRAWLEMAEAYRINQAIRECGGNRSAAARLLGIGRRTLYAKLEKLGINAG